MTMTVNNKAVKGCSGLPLLTELPRGLIFSEICSQGYSGKDREFTSCVAPLSRVGSLAITGLVPQGCAIAPVEAQPGSSKAGRCLLVFLSYFSTYTKTGPLVPHLPTASNRVESGGGG